MSLTRCLIGCRVDEERQHAAPTWLQMPTSQLQLPAHTRYTVKLAISPNHANQVRCYERERYPGFKVDSRSSILMSIKSALCDFLLVINSNFGVSLTVFKILTFTARKWLVFPPIPCWCLCSQEAVRISGWNCLTKTRGLSLYCNPNFNCFWLIYTDGRAIAYSALRMYAICCCALKMKFP